MSEAAQHQGLQVQYTGPVQYHEMALVLSVSAALLTSLTSIPHLWQSGQYPLPPRGGNFLLGGFF
jgi:hypothetical protein